MSELREPLAAVAGDLERLASDGSECQVGGRLHGALRRLLAWLVPASLGPSGAAFDPTGAPTRRPSLRLDTAGPGAATQ